MGIKVLIFKKSKTKVITLLKKHSSKGAINFLKNKKFKNRDYYIYKLREMDFFDREVGLYIYDVFHITNKIIQQSTKKFKKKLETNKLITITIDIAFTLYEMGTEDEEVPGERVTKALIDYPILKLTKEEDQKKVTMHVIDVLIKTLEEYNIKHIEHITYYINE